MKLVLTVTKDTVTGEATSSPQMFRNEAESCRSWGQAIINLSKDNPQQVPIRDLQLYKVGTFDTETLEITPCVEFLKSAQEYIKE